jgi:hypothetical protein
MAEIEVKNREIKFRQMLREYIGMLSGFYLKFILVWLGFVAVGLGVDFFVPYTHGFVIIFHFAAALILFLYTPVMLFWLISPLLVRVVFPFTIGVLEVVRLLVLFPQYMLGEISTIMTQSDLYPPNKA